MDTEIVTKQYLQEYTKLREEIESEHERLMMISSKMISSSAGAGDGMPRGNVREQSVLALQMNIKDELEEKIESLSMEEERRRLHIEDELMKKTCDPQERYIIRLRYIDRLEWTLICRVLFEKRKSFYEEEEKYTRLMFRIHSRILEKLSGKYKKSGVKGSK